MIRIGDVTRTTGETEVKVRLGLDGEGAASISTGVGFLDHLLGTLAHHALFDLEIATSGDLVVDDHHSVEDTAIALGAALAEALGDGIGIARFGDARVPMDESLAEAAVDLSGRAYSVIDLPFVTERIGNLTTQNIAHALESMARAGGFTLHLTARGRNDHHLAEAAFKALARALRTAVTIDPRREGIPSTKGSR
jgi:imidazoleglycerol-phosphate dehydratase